MYKSFLNTKENINQISRNNEFIKYINIIFSRDNNQNHIIITFNIENEEYQSNLTVIKLTEYDISSDESINDFKNYIIHNRSSSTSSKLVKNVKKYFYSDYETINSYLSVLICTRKGFSTKVYDSLV